MVFITKVINVMLCLQQSTSLNFEWGLGKIFIRHVLKKFMIFISYSKECEKLILRKQPQPLTNFAYRFIIKVWQGSEYASGCQYARVLNIPGI